MYARTNYVCLAADVNECTDASHNCHAKANCSNTKGSFHCACIPGYSGNGITCTGTRALICTLLFMIFNPEYLWFNNLLIQFIYETLKWRGLKVLSYYILSLKWLKSKIYWATYIKRGSLLNELICIIRLSRYQNH